MTHVECPRCGQRALSVASRCPRCGHEFPDELLRNRPPMPGRRPLRRGPLALAAAVVVGVAALLVRGDHRPADPGPPAAAPPVRQDTVAAATEPAPATADTADTPAPVRPTEPAAPPPVGPVPARRWAVDWVNVRERRGSRAPVVRVLEPGDAVLVDSLRRGWYRVLANGRTLGYAHRRFLAGAPPGATP